MGANGCAGTRTNGMRSLVSPAPTSLYVRNQNWHDMNIYFVSESGSLVRVGRVVSLTNAVIKLRGRVKAEISLGANARFVLRPLGSRDTYVTHYVNVGPGDQIQLTVANQLTLSTVVLR